MCQSFRGDVWVRFAPGQTGCCCESVPDLLKTVRYLLTGKFVIAVVSKKDTWVETSVRRAGTKPVLRRGETVAIYSWRSRRKLRAIAKKRVSA